MATLTPDILTSIYEGGKHVAACMTFDKLYHGLMVEVAKDNVKVIEEGDLRLFSYTVDCNFDNQWNEFSLISRGFILDVAAKKIVALSFPKFFNWGETGYFLPDEPFTITDKKDGSLGIVFYHGGKWNVATRGSFHSEQARWAAEWLHKNVNTETMSKHYTYLAEIIYHENKIVIPYDFEGLVLIGAYDLTTGFEVPRIILKNMALRFGIRITEEYEYDSIDELVEIAQTLPATREGFVVRFQSGYRLKIKGDEYCRVHKLISNVKPIYIWECMVNGDGMDEIRKQLPEELLVDFDSMRKILQAKFDSFMSQIEAEHERTKHMSDKELGLSLKERKGDMNEVVRNTVFLVRKKNLLEEAYVGGSGMRETVFKMFKPKANKLVGYVPTNVMNRFDQ